MKKLTPGRYMVPKFVQTKKRRHEEFPIVLCYVLFYIPIDPIITIRHTIRYVIQNFPIKVECWFALSSHLSRKCHDILA